jgi:hypothetical protein
MHGAQMHIFVLTDTKWWYKSHVISSQGILERIMP